MIHQFQNDLNKLERELIETWYNETGNKIGLSIQIDSEVQDESSATRDTKACDIPGIQTNLINAYCANVLEDTSQNNIRFCNGLDFHLKNILSSRNNTETSIGCRCHKGISNFIIPYRYLNLDPTFYIFIGQFLIKPFNGEFQQEFLHQENLWLLNQNEIDADQTRSQYIQADPFISVSTRNEKEVSISKQEEKEGKVQIAHVDFREYVAYKNFVLYRFEKWIENYYEPVPLASIRKRVGFIRSKEKNIPTHRPKPILKSFMKHETIDSVLYFLEYAKEVKSKKFGYDNQQVINEIIDFVNVNKMSLDNINTIRKLKEFSKLYQEGHIFNSEKYAQRGRKLLNVIATT